MTNAVHAIINASCHFFFFDEYYINRLSQISVCLGQKLVAVMQAASILCCAVACFLNPNCE